MKVTLILRREDGKERKVCDFMEKFKACNFMCVVDLIKMLTKELEKLIYEN